MMRLLKKEIDMKTKKVDQPELSDDDKRRIEQTAIKYDRNTDRIGGFMDGAEYATRYEREQRDIILKAIYDNALVAKLDKR